MYLVPSSDCNRVTIPDTKNVVFMTSAVTREFPLVHISGKMTNGKAIAAPKAVKKCCKETKQLSLGKNKKTNQ